MMPSELRMRDYRIAVTTDAELATLQRMSDELDEVIAMGGS
jgi:hypothetical protein